MEPSTDPLTMLLTTGGGGLGGGAITAYILAKLAGKNNTNELNSNNNINLVATKLDHTNELLNELLRSHARLEGLLQNINQRS